MQAVKGRHRMVGAQSRGPGRVGWQLVVVWLGRGPRMGLQLVQVRVGMGGVVTACGRRAPHPCLRSRLQALPLVRVRLSVQLPWHRVLRVLSTVQGLMGCSNPCAVGTAAVGDVLMRRRGVPLAEGIELP